MELRPNRPSAQASCPRLCEHRRRGAVPAVLAQGERSIFGPLRRRGILKLTFLFLASFLASFVKAAVFQRQWSQNSGLLLSVHNPPGGVVSRPLCAGSRLTLIAPIPCPLILATVCKESDTSALLMGDIPALLMAQGSLRRFPLSQVHHLFSERFGWCPPSETLSGCAVQAVANRLHIAI